MCAKEKFYRNLVRTMGRPELAQDERFGSFADRLKNREALVAILKNFSRQKTTAEWLKLLKGQVPCAPVNTVEEAFRHPQVIDDEMILEFEHPDFGAVRQVAGPIKSAMPRLEHRRGPKLGEHTEEVLREYLDLSPEAIEDLRRQGVV